MRTGYREYRPAFDGASGTLQDLPAQLFLEGELHRARIEPAKHTAPARPWAT